MPRIPTQEIRESLTTQTPSAQIPISEAGQEGRMLQGAGEVLGQITQKFEELRDFRQITQAENEAMTQLDALERQALTDPDIDDLGKYETEVNNIRNNTTKNITSQLAKEKYQANFGTKAFSSLSNIRGTLWKRQMDRTDTELTKFTNIMAEGIFKNPMTKPIVMEEVTKRIDDAVLKGQYTQEVGYKKKEDFYKKIRVGEVKYDIYADQATQEKDSEVIRQLNLGENGAYKDLLQEERVELKAEAQRRVFNNNQTFKREVELTKDKRFNGIFDKMNENTLSLQDIDNEMLVPEEIGGIPKKQLLDIKKGITSRVKTDLEVIIENSSQATKYLKFIDNYIEDENDRQKGREYLAKAYGDMILSSQEASFLNKIQREAEDIEFARTSDNIPKWLGLRTAVKNVREAIRGRKNSSEADAAMAIKKLLNGLSQGRDTREITKEVLKEHAIKANPELLNIPKDGQIMLDSDGVIKLVDPELEVKEYIIRNTKTKETK